MIDPPESIPDIQPHIQTYMLLGRYSDVLERYSIAVTPAGVFALSPSGRGGSADRYDVVENLVGAMHSLSAGSAHLHDPFMLWFRPGYDFTGDKGMFSIFNGFFRAFRSYHQVRAEGYQNLTVQYEGYLEIVSDDSSSSEEDIEGWETQVRIVSRLAEREAAFAKGFDDLCGAERLLGKEKSIPSIYASLIDNQQAIIRRYV